jgi:sugar-specific transcriptional regulator TrmB
MTKEEDIQTLTELGLTISQAKVYLSLLELGKAAGRTIAQHSKVARQEAYRILAELMDKGLVEKILSTPTEFEPILIEDCASLLIERKKNQNSETLRKATVLLQKHKENFSHEFQEEAPQFVLVSEKNVLRTIKKIIENTQTSLDVITTFNRFRSGMVDFAEVGNRTLKRGITLRIITNKPKDGNSLEEMGKAETKGFPFEIKYINTPPLAVIAIYDKKEVIIAISAADINEVPILKSNNPSLIAVAQNYFETVWNVAHKLNETP